MADQASKDTQSTTKAKTTTAAATAPSDKDIAKAKGLVWVNTNTKVYHTEGQFYGKTKEGKFMTAADAQKAGYRAATEPAASKKTTVPAKK